MSLLLRLALLAAGLVFAASLAVAVVFVLFIWSVRALWARLTGRPVTPLVFRIDPREGFGRVYRSRWRRSQFDHGSPAPGRADPGDVTDVQPK